MRVTQQMLNTQMLGNLTKNLGRIEKVQEQLATSRKINRPSDDPVGLTYAMRYRSELTASDQYARNLDSAISWVDYQETMVRQAVDVLQRARELTVNAANGTNPNEAYQSIAAEIDELVAQLHEIANSQFNGKYVFNGQRTDQPPYPDIDSYATIPATFDTGKISFEVSNGVVIDVNLHAGEVFGQPGAETGNNIFATLKELSGYLNAGNEDGITHSLANLDLHIDDTLQALANLGARSNRLDLIENRLADGSINVQALLSKTEDADMAEVITNLKMEEAVYQASLSAGARIIRPSLIDFLR